MSPRRGFYVIVPLEYRSAGGPPASWFVDHWLAFQRRPYYVGLLSAAAIHGAAHQQPQELQVISDRPLRPTRLGRARIRFFAKRRAASTPTTAVRTETGTMRVSTPEATALDLVRYAPQAASLAHVATVLSELSERIAPLKLLEAARAEADLSSAQRLGYLLDTVQAAQLTGPLAKWIARRRPRPVALRPDRPVRGASQDRRWRVIVNEKIEAES